MVEFIANVNKVDESKFPDLLLWNSAQHRVFQKNVAIPSQFLGKNIPGGDVNDTTLQNREVIRAMASTGKGFTYC